MVLDGAAAASRAAHGWRRAVGSARQPGQHLKRPWRAANRKSSEL